MARWKRQFVGDTRLWRPADPEIGEGRYKERIELSFVGQDEGVEVSRRGWAIPGVTASVAGSIFTTERVRIHCGEVVRGNVFGMPLSGRTGPLGPYDRHGPECLSKRANNDGRKEENGRIR